MFDWLVATLQAKSDFMFKVLLVQINVQISMIFGMDNMNMLPNKFCKFQANRMKMQCT